MVSGRVATSLCFKARLSAKPSSHVTGMTRLDLSKPKKLELRLSPLLNQWTGASQPRLQFYSPTVEKTWNATVQFSTSRSLSHGTVKGRYIFFFSDWRVVWVVLISLLSYWSSRNLRPCPIVSSRGDSAY